jgi:hypothetical protein
MSSRFLTLGLVLGAVAGACFMTHRQQQRRLGLSHTPHAAPVEVQTWEGEGGAVPLHSHNVREVDGDGSDPFSRPGIVKPNGAALMN